MPPICRHALTNPVHWSTPIKGKLAIISLLAAAALGLAWYHWVYRSRHRLAIETDYVISPSLDVFDTYAEVHTVLDVLKAGDHVDVLRRAQDWAEVRLPGGATGWVLANQLIGPETHAAGQKLLGRIATEQVQALGHTSGMVNLRVEPSRQAPQISVLNADEKIEMFERRLVERIIPGPSSSGSAQGKSVPEAWYLVRADSQAGWVLGRLITLDIPAEISQYSQSYNMVAWRELETVEDMGRKIPEYVVADRVGTQDVDFNHIRVFTWSRQQHQYTTAFVQSGLDGEFPIQVERTKGVPYFLLRLKDKGGREFQKAYGLFDTIVRPVVTVEGRGRVAMPLSRHAPQVPSHTLSRR